MRSTLPPQACIDLRKRKSRGTMFETDTVAAISCVPPVRPSLAISVTLKANEGKSWGGNGFWAMHYSMIIRAHRGQPQN